MNQEIFIEQLEFINKKLFYFFQKAQQQYLTYCKMIYGITDGDEHLKSILTQRLGTYEIFKRL